MSGDRQIALVGAGRAAVALGAALRSLGWHIAWVWSRTQESADRASLRLGCPGHHGNDLPDATNVIVAVSDDALKGMASRLAGCEVILHTSGSLSSSVLEASGAAVGSFHPLHAMPDAYHHDDGHVANELVGVFVAIEGDDAALSLARELTSDLGARAVEIPKEGKVLYHASAVMLSNYMVTLFAHAQELMERAGVEEEDARAMLIRLGESALSNLQHLSAEQALTGPVRRGDVETVRHHLEAFESHGLEGAESLYRALLGPTAQLAARVGLPAGAVAVFETEASSGRSSD